MNSRNKDKAIAGGVTLIVSLLILLILMFTNMGRIDRAMLARTSIPEPEETELFLEPELDLNTPGENNDLPDAGDAPLPKGEPEHTDKPEPDKELVIPGKNENPAPVTEPVTTQKRPSPVKVTENRVTTEEEKRLKSMEGKFKKSAPGDSEGKVAAVNGKGKVNTSGSLHGRGFNGCTTYPVEVTGKVTVRVNVKVNAAGKVVEARAASGPAPYRTLCEGWARTATWTPQSGAPVASGSITFTISPNPLR